MAILVTGGAGFIGSHLLEALWAATEEELVCLDNFNSYYDPARKRQNLRNLVGRPRFTLIAGDLCDQDLVARAVRQHRVRRIIHLAAYAGVRRSVEIPLVYSESNVQGTLTLLEIARAAQVERFVFASSSTVYGKTAPAPFHEDALGAAPASPYGVSKRAGELYCRMYTELHGLSTVGLRLFSVYGPRLRPDLAMSIFTAAILRGTPLPLFGDGSIGRDYTYVTDIVAGIRAALDAGREVDGEWINLGNNQPVLMRRIIELLERSLGRAARIEYLPPQASDMPITFANIDKAARLLGYQPRVPIEEGIEKFVRWYLEQDEG